CLPKLRRPKTGFRAKTRRTAKTQRTCLSIYCATRLDYAKLYCQYRIKPAHRKRLLQRVAIQPVRCAVSHLSVDNRCPSARHFGLHKKLRVVDCPLDLIIGGLENLNRQRRLVGDPRPLARKPEITSKHRIASKLLHGGTAFLLALVS